MSSTRIEVREAETSFRIELPDADAHRLLAALAADPETVQELSLAMGRFLPAADPDMLLALSANPPADQEQAELKIDLPGRVILGRNLPFPVTHEGQVSCRLEDGEDCGPFRYHLAGDWRTITSHDQFEATCRAGRGARQTESEVDEREVLFGRDLCRYLVEQLRAKRVELTRADREARHAIHADIHRRWLMSPLEALGAECPRDRLIDNRHEQIAQDVEDQLRRWSVLRIPPPALPSTSRAYRQAGFGRQEVILYYDLIRYLLARYTQRLLHHRKSKRSLDSDVNWLSGRMQKWWNEESEEHGNEPPGRIAESERSRLPHTAVPDYSCDCPLCQAMQVEQSINGSPSFFFLDELHLDDEFEFSLAATREAWEPHGLDVSPEITDAGPQMFGPTIVQPVRPTDGLAPDTDSPFGGQSVHVTMPMNQNAMESSGSKAGLDEGPGEESRRRMRHRLEMAMALEWIDEFVTRLTAENESHPEIGLRLSGAYRKLATALCDPSHPPTDLNDTGFLAAFEELVALRPGMKAKCDELSKLIRMTLDRRRAARPS